MAEVSDRSWGSSLTFMGRYFDRVFEHGMVVQGWEVLTSMLYWGLGLPTVAIDKGVVVDGVSLAWLGEREKDA